METENEAIEPGVVWVDWENRVISFHEAAGFEKLEYLTRQEMLAFAVSKGSEGFAIQ